MGAGLTEGTSPPAPLRRGEGRKKRATLSSGVVALQYVDEHKKEQARRLRQASTPGEKKLWCFVRNRKVSGLKFRRQQVIEGFIADFFCEEIKLAVEVDGTVHNDVEQKRIDEYREKVFSARGITTIRFPNDDVLNHIDECIRQIADIANEQKRLIQAPLRAERGGRRPG